MEMVTLKCYQCGTEFQKRKSAYKRRLKLGQKLFFCGKGCSWKAKTTLRERRQVRYLSELTKKQKRK